MQIIALLKFNMKVEIITGTQAGNFVYILKIILDTGKFSILAFILYRREFSLLWHLQWLLINLKVFEV